MTTHEPTAPQLHSDFEAAFQAPAAMHEVLRGGVEYSIDPNTPLARDEKSGCDVAAIITTSANITPGEAFENGLVPDSFLVVDLRKLPVGVSGAQRYKVFNGRAIRPETEFMIIGKEYEGNDRGSKGVRQGETVEMGHSDPKTNSRFDFGEGVSRRHFSLKYDTDGRLTILDHSSTNGTTVTSSAPIRQRVEVQPREQQEAAFKPKTQLIEAMPDFAKPVVAPAAAKVPAEVAPAKKEVSPETMNRIRAEADNKYMQVMSFTGDNVQAQAAADRVWANYGLSDD